MPVDITEIIVDRSRCARAEWPEGSLLDHYEKRAGEDARIKSVVAYERMARDAIRKGHIFWFKYHGRMRIGFYNSKAHILTVVSRDQSRILTCIIGVSYGYVKRIYQAEGAGRIVDWPGCTLEWEIHTI